MSLETDKYSCIARLDDELEDEKWEERTAVITRNDHEEYLAAANSILHDLLGDVKTPVKRYLLPLTTNYCYPVPAVWRVCKLTLT